MTSPFREISSEPLLQHEFVLHSTRSPPPPSSACVCANSNCRKCFPRTPSHHHSSESQNPETIPVKASTAFGSYGSTSSRSSRNSSGIESQNPETIPVKASTALSSYGSTSGRSSRNSSSIVKISSPEPVNADPGDIEASIRCKCHVKIKDDTSRKARIKLIVACIIALAFMIGEVVGGYFSHSLAIMTDAAHMLSDFASFLISLFSIWMATRPPSKRMSFGWYRAEVMGAVISVLIIWLITGVLVYEAILRVIHYDKDIDADIMLITACVGVFVNVFMCTVLHQHDHGHGHGHGHGHEHSHGHRSSDHHHDDGGDGNNGEGQKKKKGGGKNINVRAAFIHVIGDLIQSIGVVIAGYIIKFFPQWHIVDPICTFLFSILVIISTLNVLRDAMLVLMEGAPRNIDTEAVENDLRELKDVEHAHNIHIWSLTVNKAAIAAHLAIDKEADTQTVLTAASAMLSKKYGFSNTTLQVEHFQDEMSSCGSCQKQPNSKGYTLRGVKE